jgi:exodeoxyribonuclease-3
MDIPGYADPQRRVLAATVNGVRIVNLYVPNGESVTSDKYRYKLDWLEKLRNWLEQEARAHSRVVVLGDFNIAPAENDVHDPAKWEGHVLCSDPERAALRAVEAIGFKDCFRLHEQPEKSFSWWDYRMNAFRRNMGLRIDLILATADQANRCQKCYIDKIPRGWERPSDHAPVVAVFDS